jgi:hypothetical protein
MSVDNFIPTWWSANVIAPLRKTAVFTSPFVVNRNWEGEIKAGGDTVKINQIGDVTVSDYTKNSTTITYAALESAGLLLKVDQAKFFSFVVDSIDKAQAKGDISMLGLEQASYKLKDAEDSYVATIGAAQAGVTTDLGTTATPLAITAADTATVYTGIIDLLSLIGAALDTANCPSEGRFIIVPPSIRRKLVKAAVLDVRSTTQQQEAATLGKVQNALGFNILVSNNCVNAGTVASPKWKILAGTTQAITFAEQITLIESLKIQGQFGDAVRGLMVYGAKVVQANALACATCSVAAG